MTLIKNAGMETIEPIKINHLNFKESKADRHQAICQRLNETYRKKNSDYGNSYDRLFEEHGEVTAIIRIKDKVYRLAELLNHPAEVTDESKIDSCLDGANYLIMYAMKMMEKKNN
jgi:hypothetical protein